MGKGKVTKRERKFQSSGGVQGRIKKGTIAKKGKLRKRGGNSSNNTTSSNNIEKVPSEFAKRDRSTDFTSDQNLAGLDIESFFNLASDQIDNADNINDVEESSASSLDDDNNNDIRGRGNCLHDQEKENDNNEENLPLKSVGSSNSSSSSIDSDELDSENEGIGKIEARMRQHMAKMETIDPSFHQFLKENEESLLEFDEGDDGDDDDDDDGDVDDDDNDNDDNDEDDDKDNDDIDNKNNDRMINAGVISVVEKDDKPSNVHRGKDNQLTSGALQEILRDAFESKGVKGLKKLISAYKSACHLSDAEGDAKGSRARGKDTTTWVIDSAKVLDDLMLQCLSRCHALFSYHLLDEDVSTGRRNTNENSKDNNEIEEPEALDEIKPIQPKALEKSTKWTIMKPILLSFFRSTLHLLMEAKEPELLCLILQSLTMYLPYASPFPRMAENLLKTTLQLWSAPLESSEDYQVVRLQSFLRIRQLALTQPFPFIEDCLKKIYLSYASRAKFGSNSSHSTLPTLTFMGNCVVELYSLDYHSAYHHAFVYIRQLALLLRSAMQKKSVEGVYSWQYMNCCKLWVAVLSAAAVEEDGAALQSLVYPLTEIILGTARLSPSPRYLPIRLSCVRLLHQLASSSETFIPCSSLLLDCLKFKEWNLAPKKTRNATRPIHMDSVLKLPATDQIPCLRTAEQSEPAITELMTLLQHEIELYRFSPGFPEYSMGMESRLKTFAKTSRNSRWRTYARGCLDTIQRNSTVAITARSKLHEAPRDILVLEAIKPPSTPPMRERLKALLEMEREATAAHHANTDPSHIKKRTNEDKIFRKKKVKRSTNTDGEKVTTDRSSSNSRIDQEDIVQDGVIWSDEEAESDS